jgi:DNA gyrase/topoisomerase IV subunit B
MILTETTYKSPLRPPIFRFELKKQVWFQTNLGFEATKGKLRQSRQIVGDMQDSRGRLSFHIKDIKDVTFQITTQAKLSITYPKETDFKTFQKRLEPFLVKADGTPAEVIRIIKESSKAKEELSESKNGKRPAKYHAITELPEYKEADLSKMDKQEFEHLQFLNDIITTYGYRWCLEEARLILKKYPKK